MYVGRENGRKVFGTRDLYGGDGEGASLYFFVALDTTLGMFSGSRWRDIFMNAELCSKALEKVGNPNVLVNIISRRVRQLNSGSDRPLVADYVTMGLADIALTELIEDKMGYELLVPIEEPAKPKKKKRKSS